LEREKKKLDVLLKRTKERAQANNRSKNKETIINKKTNIVNKKKK